MLTAHSRSMSNPWIARTKPSGAARSRLFCFPFAGGGTTGYRAWSSCFPRDIEVCPIQLPGRECRVAETPAKNLSALAESIAAGLLPVLGMPFAFFGHSLGAIIAFEVARELRKRRANTPEHLFLSGHGPAFLDSNRNPFHLMPDGEFLERVQRFGGLPDAVIQHPELLQIVLPALRADFEMYETHRHAPGAPLDIPITALGGLTDSSVPAEHLAAWRGETTGRFTIRLLPGGHFYLQEAGSILAGMITRELQGSLCAVC